MKTYTLPELPYSHSALEPHYSARLLRLHHEKHHAAYVDGANAALDRLAEAQRKNDFSALNQLQSDLAFHVSGHVLHSLFWSNLSPEGGDRPEGEMKAAVCDAFGTLEGFEKHFSEAALAVQGSGWSALAWEPLGRRLIVEQIHDHQGNAGSGTVPILVLDMWEHAYYLQHQNVRADWIRSFWKMVNWQDVAHRFENARLLDSSPERMLAPASMSAPAAGLQRFWPMRSRARRDASRV